MARPARILTEEQRRELLQTQSELTALTHHPAWVTYEREIAAKIERIEKVALRQALSPKVSVEQLANLRGQIDGLKWLVAAPASAEKRLERFLQEQRGEEAQA